MGDENLIRSLGDYSKPSHEGYRNTIELPEGNNVVPLRSDTIRLVLALYDNESWNDQRDFAKPVKAFSLPQDVPSTSDHLVPTTLNIAWKISSKLLLITHPRVLMKQEAIGTLSSPSKTTLVTPIIRHGKVTQTLASQDARLSKFEADFKQQGKMTNKINKVLKAITDRITGSLPSDTFKNLKLNVKPTSPVLSAHSYPMEDL
ncbi:hypothetical protein Tco_0726181 [Tanacetum coccineum]|uniref:MAK10-like protein n=1 Tax=Tanacetum coccineum TaxID=301880 RepID=A0ABQ4YH66_9ASTR